MVPKQFVKEGAIVKKLFYLVTRKDVLIKGKPVYYCRFRNTDGDLLPWRSTRETSKTCAEIWALSRLCEARVQRENITLAAFVDDFWKADNAFAETRADHVFSLSLGYLDIAEGYTRNHLIPVWGSWRLRDMTPGKIDAWIVRLHREKQLAPDTPDTPDR